MNVLVINSPLFRYSQGLDVDDSLPPVGLGYIASHLLERNIETELLDCVNEKLSLADTIKYIEKKNPKYVAINIFSTNYELVKEIVLGLNDGIHLIIGGLATNYLYKKIFQWKTNNKIDIVSGDGEYITADIVCSSVKVAADLSFENKRLFKIGPESPYYVSDISNVTLDRNLFRYEPIHNYYGVEEINISTSRGCIYNCSFCAAARSQSLQFTIRYRSIESLIAELNQININHPNVASIRIIDDLFLKSQISINDAITIFSGFRFSWRSMSHVRTMANTGVSKMAGLKKSGCQELFIGIESGSPRILKKMNKTHDLEVITKSIMNVLSQGINVKAYFICGFPGEELEDLKRTLELAIKLKNIASHYDSEIRYSVFQFRPYHGTEIYAKLQPQITTKDLLIKPNKTLSSLIGRDQFNFYAGNYAKACLDSINDYICRIQSLNGSYEDKGYNPTNNNPMSWREMRGL